MKLVAALVAGGVLTVAVATQITDVVGPAYEAVAVSSIQTVVRAAQTNIGAQNGTTPWPVALADAAVALSQGGDAITVDGTVVRWVLDQACFEADVPYLWAVVEVRDCAVA
jgi:hypothetical protein